MEKLTREELLEKIKNNDVEWFSNNYFENDWSSSKPNFQGNKFKTCWDLNFGDGNEWTIALDFFEENVTVVMEGYYSSYGGSGFHKVGIGIPYEYKEIRYRIATKQDLRDLKLDEMFNG